MTNILINFLSAYPPFLWLFTAIATLTVICTAIHPIIKKIVEATKTKKDDEWLIKVENNAFVKMLAKAGDQLKRFSLIK
jgi:hypothetical protein